MTKRDILRAEQHAAMFAATFFAGDTPLWRLFVGQFYVGWLANAYNNSPRSWRQHAGWLAREIID